VFKRRGGGDALGVGLMLGSISGVPAAVGDVIWPSNLLSSYNYNAYPYGTAAETSGPGMRADDVSPGRSRFTGTQAVPAVVTET
jgi:hypothetical protein